MSTENPPDDPSCSCKLLHLTSSSNEFGQSSLDHHHHNHHLPNFSIRDYVCSFRNKDIENNWPFSPEILQLCLKHGINEPLPPFQPLGAVENQCAKRCSTKACSSLEKQIISNVELKIPACFSEKSKLDNLGSNQTTAETRKEVDSSSFCQPRAENDLLPTTSVSQSEVELFTVNKNPSKKCGLILKSGACVNRVSKEDSCLATSESMASKTCPVCKTFSSASNTTLNAHIDQCLSADSAPPNSKPNRHRIKPRKIRLMTDIYATAKGCTLDELDKRNGTRWATISKYSTGVADKSEVSNKEKKRKALPRCPDGDASRVGPVYIDASGKKLRILSEFSENASSVLGERKDVRAKKKFQREVKGSRCFSTKKKNRWAKKYHKHLKLTPQSRKLFSHKADASEISEHQEGYTGGRSGKERLQIPRQLKPGQPRTLYKRKLAKRTALARKLNKKGHKFHVSRDQPFDNEDSWLEDSTVVRSPTHKSADLSGSTVSSSLNKQKIWESCGVTQVTGKNETLFESKRARSPLLRVQIIENKERPLVTVQQNTYQSKKNIPSVQERFSAGQTFSMDTLKHPGVSPGANGARNLSPTFAAKASKFCVSQDKSSTSEAKAVRRLKKDWSYLLEKEDEKMWKRESEMDQEHVFTDDDSDESEMDQEHAFTDNGEMDEILMNPDSSIGGDDDYDDDESTEEDANNDNDALDKADGAEYQSDTPPSTEIRKGSTFSGGQAMYYGEEVGERIYGEAAGVGTDPDSEVGQGNSFMEVDPIPIPGPPGSFLPSPRDIGSDDFPGNSSVTTSQIQSSQDQPDLTDRNSSESPVSIASADSNFAAAAGTSSHANYRAGLSSTPEKIASGVTTSYFTSTMNSGFSSQQKNSVAEGMSDGEKFNLHSISIDKRLPGSRDDDQPCCCQRKERSSEGITVNHQESQPLKRRAASSITVPETRRPTGFDPNKISSNSDAVLNSLDPYIFQDSDLQRKFPDSIHRASVSPSSLVLRLMGKDLMVVNQGEEASTPVSHGEPSLHPRCRFLDPSRTSESSIETFHHATPQLSSPLLQSPGAGSSICFNGSNCFGNNTISTAPQTPAQAPTDALHNNFGHVPYFSPR